MAGTETGREEIINPAFEALGEFLPALGEVYQRISQATDADELGALWDQFWEINPDGGDFGADLTEYLVPILRQRAPLRVLCVGNGKALEAHALAAAGFKVDSLDISPSVKAFLEAVKVSNAVLARILKEPCDGELARPTIYTGDILNAEDCPGPYDTVIIRRTVQHFPDEAIPRVMELICNRLTDTGLLVLQGHNAGQSLSLAARWLYERKIPVAWNLCHKDGRHFAYPGFGTYRKSRVAWLIRSSG